jgi:hypothetical protein
LCDFRESELVESVRNEGFEKVLSILLLHSHNYSQVVVHQYPEGLKQVAELNS